MQIKKYGAPGAYLVSSNFLKDVKSAAFDWLMPNMRIIKLPSDKWYRLRGNVQELRPLVETAFNPIVEALMKPLTPEEAKPQKRYAVEYPPVRITGADYEDAVEKFNVSFLENKMGDGGFCGAGVLRYGIPGNDFVSKKIELSKNCNELTAMYKNLVPAFVR